MLVFNEAWKEDVSIHNKPVSVNQLESQLQSQIDLIENRYQTYNDFPKTGKGIFFQPSLLEKAKARFLLYNTEFAAPLTTSDDVPPSDTLQDDYNAMRYLMCGDNAQCLDLLREVYFETLRKRRELLDAEFDIASLSIDEVSISRYEPHASLTNKIDLLQRMVRSKRIPALVSVLDVLSYAERESASIRIELRGGHIAELHALPDAMTKKIPEWWSHICLAKEEHEKKVNAYKKKKAEKEEKEKLEKEERESEGNVD
tara:strand:+ start:326 stop:1096 length:771 start_codon:yes stop_codon:yes gene_type:complete